MYTTDVLAAVIPVKYALGLNVRISSVPANKGIVELVEVMTVALEVDAALVLPTPMKTVTVPLLRMRYWLPPKVVDTACTGDGAVVFAVNMTVLPVGVNACVPIITPVVLALLEEAELLLVLLSSR